MIRRRSAFDDVRAIVGLCVLIGGIVAVVGRTNSLRTEPSALPNLGRYCRSGPQDGASSSDFAVTRHGGGPADLPYFAVEDMKTSAVVRIYFDQSFGGAVREKASCIGAEFAMLASLIPDQATEFEWSPIALTAGAGYFPLRRQVERRWPKATGKSNWSTDADDFVFRLVPHEEVHACQDARRPTGLPTWFREGQADWAGLKVTAQLRPDVARVYRERLGAALKRSPDIDLAEWRVAGREMVERVALTASLNGALESGTRPEAERELSRNAAALALFDGLERRHGQAAVQAWIADVLAAQGNDRIVSLARQRFGEDIGPLLHRGGDAHARTNDNRRMMA